MTAARVFLARLHLRVLGLSHANSTRYLLTIASARNPRLTAAQILELQRSEDTMIKSF